MTDARTIDNATMMRHVESHPYPILFATISGAHLYGFPSPDSDFDLRGVHTLPLETVVGLDEGDQTVEKEGIYDGLEIDLVTHEAEKFFRLMLKRNGYVLEQVFSPLVVHRHSAPRGAQVDRPEVHYASPRTSLPRLRGNSVEAVRKGVTSPRQATALRVPRAADGDSFDAHR